MFTTVRNWVDQHRWCNGSIVAFQAIDMGSLPVRCRSYNLDGIFAVIFVTKENTTLTLSFSSVGIEEHHWCSGSIVAFQAIDMVLITAWRRRPSLIRNFQENLSSEGFKSIDISTVQIWVDKHRWCSGSIVGFQAIDMGSIPVRCRSYNIDANFAVLFVTKENTTPMFSFSSVGIEEHHWCSGSTAHLQAIDMGSSPAWRRRPSLIRNFQENLSSEGFKSIDTSTVQIRVDKHRWCCGSIVAFQAIDMGLLPAWRRRPSLIIIFQENLYSGGFKSIEISNVQIWVDKHRWCSGSIVTFQGFEKG